MIDRGYVPCWFDPQEALPSAPGHEDANIDLLTARHRDVSLWEVAAYDFCVRHELSLAEAEASMGPSPKTFAESTPGPGR